jgi:hypothetical protein
MLQNQIDGKTIKVEPPVFWVFTATALAFTILMIILFTWFVYIGHEPFEPVHDEFPHAFLTKVQNNYA